MVTAADKDLTHNLLRAYSIPFISTGRSPSGNHAKAVIGILKKVSMLLQVIRKNRIDSIISFESPYAVMAGRLSRKKTITFTDTEAARIIHNITGRLSSTILVPSCFQKTLSHAQISFKGYKELAYLHPLNYQPDKKIAESCGIVVSEPYSIIRFVSFNALHDRGFRGFSDENKIRLVRTLSTKMKVYISSESTLIPELQPYRLNIPPENMHHVIAYATMFIGDSATMSAEAAVMGVPSVCANHMNLGYLKELSEKYGLVFKYDLSANGQQAAIEKTLEIADNCGIKEEFKAKKELMLADKTDVAAFMVWFIENYPESAGIMKGNPDYQNNFR